MDSRCPVFLLFFTNQNNLEYKGQGSKTLATISSLISGEGLACRKKAPRRINSSKDPLVDHLAFCEESLCPSMNVIYLHVDGCVHAMVEVRGQPGVSPCLPSCLDTRVSCLPLSTAENLACEVLANFPTCCRTTEIMDLHVS